MLPKKNRVTTKLFPQILEKGFFFNSPHFSLKVVVAPSPIGRLSVVVSKKVQKTAVGRNSIKRKVRAALSPLIYQIKPITGVFFAKKETQSLSFGEIQNEIQSLLRQAKVL